MRIVVAMVCMLVCIPCFAVPVKIDVGDYVIEAEANVSINITVPITVYQNGKKVLLTEERYNSLITTLGDIYKEKTGVGNITFNISFHPFAIEYFSATRRDVVYEYWKKVFSGEYDPNDSSKLPDVEPLPTSMLIDEKGSPLL